MSSLGVTGTRSEIKTDLAAIVKVVRENTKTPCADDRAQTKNISKSIGSFRF